MAPEARHPALNLVYAAWVLVLFDPHYFIAPVVGSMAGKLASLTYMALLGLLVFRLPDNLGPGRAWVLFPAYMIWLGAGLLSIPVAPNLYLLKEALKILMLYWALAVTTQDFVRTPKQAYPILLLYAFRFVWWEVWGLPQGYVPWHPSLANHDGYGALMVQGAGICYWLGSGARVKWQKMLLLAASAIAVVGVISTMARGAFLALVIVAGVVWLRSPRKVATAGALVGAAIVGTIGAALMMGGDAFYAEIMSSFDEGNESGTGLQRWELWTAAVILFKNNFLTGVGAGNFGAYAAGYFGPGDFSMFPTPSMFYGFNLHNSYMQVLVEFGAIGTIAFLWMHADFFLKNRLLRKPEAMDKWLAEGPGQKIPLYHVSLGLEAGFIALMLCNVVYANLLEAWLVCFWALNRVLWGVTRSAAPGRGAAAAGNRMPRRMARRAHA